VIVRTDRDAILTDAPGVIGGGGNSGFQAINLAVQFGAARIVLVGFDMTLAHGAHWHGRHPARLNNPTMVTTAKWRERLDAVAPAFAALGIEVLNASPISALTAYRKVSIEEALG
jgi:hypothetical protein